MQGLPSGRGRKGGRPKRKRVRESLSEILTTITPSSPLTQSQAHCSGVNIASGTSSHVTVSLPHSLPPPLIGMDPTDSSPPALSEPPNVNPFYIKFITGNIRVCQGCNGSLKTTDNRIPIPPFDIAAARAENRPFRDVLSGNLITPKHAPKRATVYH